MDFQLVTNYKPRGDQPRAIDELVQGLGAGEKHQVLLGVTGSGKTFTMAKVIEQSQPAGADPGAQQDAGGAALSRVQAVLSRQRGRVLRQLLRLLPAGGLHSGRRSLYRERSHDQRRAGQAAAFGHALPLRAARRDHRQLGELHLRPRLAGGLLRHAAAAREGPAHQPQRHYAAAGRNSLRAQRH